MVHVIIQVSKLKNNNHFQNILFLYFLDELHLFLWPLKFYVNMGYFTRCWVDNLPLGDDYMCCRSWLDSVVLVLITEYISLLLRHLQEDDISEEPLPTPQSIIGHRWLERRLSKLFYYGI